MELIQIHRGGKIYDSLAGTKRIALDYNTGGENRRGRIPAAPFFSNSAIRTAFRRTCLPGSIMILEVTVDMIARLQYGILAKPSRCQPPVTGTAEE